MFVVAGSFDCRVKLRLYGEGAVRLEFHSRMLFGFARSAYSNSPILQDEQIDGGFQI